MIDDGNEGTLDELARDPSQLVVEHVDEKSARRLQQLIRGGTPGSSRPRRREPSAEPEI